MAAVESEAMSTVCVAHLGSHLDQAATAVETLLAKAKAKVAALVMPGGKINSRLLDEQQHAAHGLAWLATYAATLRELVNYATRLEAEGKFGETEQLTVQIAAGEYLNHVAGGIPMNQGEFIRLPEFGLTRSDAAGLHDLVLIERGNTAAARHRLVELIADGNFGSSGLDETLSEMRETMRRFVETKVAPHAHQWHLDNDYVPMEIVRELAELGVFALTLPEEHGGLGLSKESMCVVSEELSRGWIAVGSLGTRAEIACELILCGGTKEQKETWLPKIASGEILPTAVFTEPNTGSDLGSLRTRAVREGDFYRLDGVKHYISNAAEAKFLVVFAKTDPSAGPRGVSAFVVDRATPGLRVSSPEKLMGIRAAHSFEVTFDGVMVPVNCRLGEEGSGFKTAMRVLDNSRLDVVATSLGLAEAALAAAVQWAKQRMIAGEALAAKQGAQWMFADMKLRLEAAWGLALQATALRTAGQPFSQQSAMAKLYASEMVAFVTDTALQLHGGIGYTRALPLERYARDARILRIYEGASEVQRNIIARGVLA